MNDITSVLLAGVGGQGVLRASDILAEALLEAGYDIKKSEVHGMAQRGGSVTSFVRFGKKVYSPTAAKGSAAILLSFEKMEALRYLDYLMPGGRVLISDEEVNPPACSLGLAKYPSAVDEFISAVTKDIEHIPAVAIALEAGNIRAANTVLLGALSPFLPVSTEIWEKTLRHSFPERLFALNWQAFILGRGQSD